MTDRRCRHAAELPDADGRARLAFAETSRRRLMAEADGPEEAFAKAELARLVRSALASLTPREERVLRMRFGFFGDRDLDLDEIAAEFSVTRERIRQIHDKALRKLKHPSRSRQLRDHKTFGGWRSESAEAGRRRKAAARRTEATRKPSPLRSESGRRADGRLRWPDMSAYGVEMKIYVLPSGTRALVVRNDAAVPDAALPTPWRGVRHRCDNIAAELRACGFEQMKSGMWVKRDLDVPLAAMRRHLGRVCTTAVSDEEVVFRVDVA